MVDYSKMLESLRKKRDLLNGVIAAMELLVAEEHGKRRGRPPKWLAAIKHGKEGQTAGQPAHLQ